jgi:hypothetical protein
MSAAAAAAGDEVVDHGEPIDEDEDDNGRWVGMEQAVAAGRNSRSVSNNVRTGRMVMQQQQAAVLTWVVSGSNCVHRQGLSLQQLP